MQRYMPSSRRQKPPARRATPDEEMEKGEKEDSRAELLPSQPRPRFLPRSHSLFSDDPFPPLTAFNLEGYRNEDNPEPFIFSQQSRCDDRYGEWTARVEEVGRVGQRKGALLLDGEEGEGEEDSDDDQAVDDHRAKRVPSKGYCRVEFSGWMLSMMRESFAFIEPHLRDAWMNNSVFHSIYGFIDMTSSKALFLLNNDPAWRDVRRSVSELSICSAVVRRCVRTPLFMSREQRAFLLHYHIQVRTLVDDFTSASKVFDNDDSAEVSFLRWCLGQWAEAVSQALDKAEKIISYRGEWTSNT